MNVALITLPRAAEAVGSEDQVGRWLCQGLAAAGCQSRLFYRHEAPVVRNQRFDWLLSNGALVAAGCRPAVYWHFNERLDLGEGWRLAELGYTHVASAKPELDLHEKLALEAAGVRHMHLPLAADCSMMPKAGVCVERQADVGYVGNWNPLYKERLPEYWLEPVAKAFGQRFAIWGGGHWRSHPTLASHWRGPMPAEGWSALHTMAGSWIAFRSPLQRRWRMTGDRLYWMAMAGVEHIVSDSPGSAVFEGLVDHVQGPGEMVERLMHPHTACGEAGVRRMQTETYAQRMSCLAGWMA